MRELFRLSMWLGILEPTGNFWGQIQGLNVPTHSESFHFLVRTLAGLIGFAPLCGVSLLLFHWVLIAPPLGARRWIYLRRAFVLSALATLAIVFSEGIIEWYAKDLAFRWGKAAGCEWIAISVIFVGPDGPFVGGRWAWLFNPLYMHGHWVIAHSLPFLVAWIVYAWRARRDPRPRAGECPACGYPLAGLDPCPECGRSAARPARGSGA